VNPHRRFYRSVWVSDLHLCSRDAQSELLHDFLDTIRCDYLYLVGDIIDVWALEKGWYWPKQYNEVVHKLLKRSRKGAHVVFIPGNHDAFFREFVGVQFGDVEIALRAVHTTADGRKLLVIHGDEFDAAVRLHPWMARLGDWAYRRLVFVNRTYNGIRRWRGKPYFSLSGAIKRKVKQAVKFLNNFEELVRAAGERQGVDGIVCGHIHQPAAKRLGDLEYYNCGDWIENCTALVEHFDGRMEILWWHEEVNIRRAAEAAGSLAGSTAADAFESRAFEETDRHAAAMETATASAE
jgi:UDP-2,3-diacylglucosamine pyrophosphatase LpxH